MPDSIGDEAAQANCWLKYQAVSAPAVGAWRQKCLTGLEACHLLTSHPSGKVSFRNLEPIGRASPSEQIDNPSDYPCPSGLVTCAKAGAIVPMEIFVEQDVVPPVGIFLKLPGSSVDRTIPARIS